MPSDIQIFIAKAQDICQRSDLNSWLCNDEVHRYVAMGSESRRVEFVKGHWFMRLAIGYLTGRAPDSFNVNQPERSPPVFTDVPGLVTSLSHCKGWVALLVLQNEHTPTLKVGIDIETERDRPNLHRLAQHSFGQEWLAKHEATLHQDFFQRWTRCEAVVKASHLPLGTQLLRQQIFKSSSADSQGLWLYHSRLTKLATQLLSSPVHLSLATPYPVQPEIFHWCDESFQRLDIPFDIARAPLAKIPSPEKLN